MGNVGRRDFLKTAAASVAAASLLASCQTKEGEPLSQKMGGVEDQLGIEWDKSVCRFCGTGCGVLVGRKNGKIVATKGDPECWSNKGLNCIKGYFLSKILYGRDRLTKPLIRKNGKLVESTWDEALDLIASKYSEILKTHGSDAVAMFGSGQWTIFEGYAALKFMKAGLGFIAKDGVGSNHLDPNARMCMASAVAAFMRTFQSDEPMGSYEDIEHADTFFTWGANMAEMHPVLFSRIIDTKMKNPDRVKIIDLGTQYTRVSEEADLYLEFQPQTDLAIANYFAHYIIKNKRYDKQFVEDHLVFKKGETNIGYGLKDGGADIPKTAGKMEKITFGEYKKFVAKYTAKHTSKISGVPEDKLKQAAEFISDPTRKVCSYWTMGFNQHTRGTWVNQLVYNIHLLTGKISKPGMGPFSLTGQPSACGTAREVGTFVHRLPADMVVKNEAHRKIAADIWKIPVEKINPKVGLHTIEMFRATETGRIKILWTQVTNPYHSMPNLNRFTKAAKEQDIFIIASDVYPTRTTEVADVVLPSAMWVEKEGAYGNAERRTQHWNKIADSPGEAKTEIWQMYEVAKRLKVDEKTTVADIIYNFNQDNYYEELWEEYRSFTLGIGKDLAPYKVLREKHGVVWPYVARDKAVNGKIDFSDVWDDIENTEPNGFTSVKWRYNSKYDPFAARFIKDHPERSFKDGIVFYKAKKNDYRATVLAVPYEPPGEVPDKEYPFWLCTGRVLEHWHTGTMTMRVPELRRVMPRAFVNFNPEDAKKYGINRGDLVRVTSRRGSVVFPADINGRAIPQKGSVFIPFFDESRMVNEITLDQYDPISKEPDYKKCAVKVEKV
ncbi:MAG: molybdopterin-dependent oxidoreductase [candidate division Zixibacteria bacterium]|nr:molybdopterin-dependent oxidoreductase [candidate division Zixibacteria bacterium]